jgi:hypothetical protein
MKANAVNALLLFMRGLHVGRRVGQALIGSYENSKALVAEPQEMDSTYILAEPSLFGDRLDYCVNASERSCSCPKLQTFGIPGTGFL